MFCLLDKTSCQVCVCIPAAGTSFLDKKVEPKWRSWPDNLLTSDLSHVASGITLQCGIFSMQVKFSWGKMTVKSVQLAEAKKPGGMWVYGFLTLIWESCFACVTFKRERRRNEEGMIDIMWLQIQVTNASTVPHWLVSLSTQDYLSLISY